MLILLVLITIPVQTNSPCVCVCMCVVLPIQLFLTPGKDLIVKDITGMEKIGQGAFATVFKAKYRKSGAEVLILKVSWSQDLPLYRER